MLNYSSSKRKSDLVFLFIICVLFFRPANSNNNNKLRRTWRTLQELEKTAILHEFRDYVDGFVLRTHSIQLDQFGVTQFLHYLSLCKKVLWIHGTWTAPAHTFTVISLSLQNDVCWPIKTDLCVQTCTFKACLSKKTRKNWWQDIKFQSFGAAIPDGWITKSGCKSNCDFWNLTTHHFMNVSMKCQKTEMDGQFLLHQSVTF